MYICMQADADRIKLEVTEPTQTSIDLNRAIYTVWREKKHNLACDPANPLLRHVHPAENEICSSQGKYR